MTRRDDIDRLARLLEGNQAARAEADREEQALAAIATALRSSVVEAPPMRPEFRSDLRAQVVAAAREQQASAPFMTRLRERIDAFKYSTRVATGTGVAAMALSTGGVAGAAEHAQPGELLYGAKLAFEDARLALTFDDVDRGERALSYAGDRLAEALLAAQNDRATASGTALAGAEDRIESGSADILSSGSSAAIAQLGESLAATTAAVDALVPLLDDQAAMAAASLLLTVEDVQDRVTTTLSPADEPSEPTPTTPAPIPVPGVDDAPPAAAPDQAPGQAPPAAGPDQEPPVVDDVVPAPDAPGVPDGDLESPDLPEVPDVEQPPLDPPDIQQPEAVPGLEEALEGAFGVQDDAKATTSQLPLVENLLDSAIPADEEGNAPDSGVGTGNLDGS